MLICHFVAQYWNLSVFSLFLIAMTLSFQTFILYFQIHLRWNMALICQLFNCLSFLSACQTAGPERQSSDQVCCCKRNKEVYFKMSLKMYQAKYLKWGQLGEYHHFLETSDSTVKIFESKRNTNWLWSGVILYFCPSHIVLCVQS